MQPERLRDGPFAGIEPPYITCWKGFRTMLRFIGG
jgi:hypothetical protein